MPDGVRREEPGDEAAVRRVVVAGFAREPGVAPIEVGLVDALRKGGFVESGWVAEVGGEIVAQALLVPVRVGDEPAMALGTVAVLPAHQNSGHGSRVVWAAIDALVRRGERLAVVVGHPTFYGRFGFVPAAVVGVQSPAYPSPYLQALALRVDHPRGEVRYPPPYDDLE